MFFSVRPAKPKNTHTILSPKYLYIIPSHVVSKN